MIPSGNHGLEASRSPGFTLIELIIFIVLISIAVSGAAPMFIEALKSSFLRESSQGRLLANESFETMRAEQDLGSGVDGINSTNFPDETGIDIGAAITFDRTISIKRAELSGSTLTCSSTDAVDGDSVRCVTVTVTNAATGEILISETNVFSE